MATKDVTMRAGDNLKLDIWEVGNKEAVTEVDAAIN